MHLGLLMLEKRRSVSPARCYWSAVLLSSFLLSILLALSIHQASFIHPRFGRSVHPSSWPGAIRCIHPLFFLSLYLSLSLLGSVHLSLVAVSFPIKIQSSVVRLHYIPTSLGGRRN